MPTICMASAQVISEYLRWMRTRNLSPATIKNTKSILHRLAIATGGRDLLTLTADDLADWQARRAEQVAARSLRTQTSAVQVFYRWCVDEQFIAADPAAKLPTPKVPRLLPKPIAEDDLQAAFDSADDWMRAVLCLAAFAGLRAAEIAGLDWTEVQLGGEEPHLRVVGKGAKERIVDLSPAVVRALRRLPGPQRGPVIRRRDRKPGRNTPSNVSQVVGRYLRSLGISASAHSGRHRAITWVCRMGGIRLAADFAGHASVSTTGGYAQVARRDCRAAVVAAGEIQAS